ncbi:MAG: penicillin-binding protein [Coriobacteriales bacterium]|jgi:penicillin-binding protein 1A|nr:penicillin-binding protein [Coriobacteriales bacterium]
MVSRTKRAKAAPKKHIIPFALLAFVLSFTLIGGVVTASGFAIVGSWLKDLPDVGDVEAFSVPQKTYVYASDETTLLATFYAEDREPVTAAEVSQHVFDASIAVEDERYWEHNGIDIMGIARAAVMDLLGDSQGASTITQQFVRQTLLSSVATERTLERKVREAALAMEVEKTYGKDAVLIMYLNTINYGDGAYGIQSAAQHYFSKNASELTLEEAALLAGIPQQPTYNNPVYYPENALHRRAQVLERMYVNKYITKEEYDSALATDLNLNLNERNNDGIFEAHYFTSYVRSILQEDYGSTAVFNNGLKVITTIDMNMQAAAEKACKRKEKTLDKDVEVSLTCVEPSTGYILAMRGGKDYRKDEWSTSTDMRRQAGSTFKAFALVACLEEGISPSTPVLGSSPLKIDDWKVANYGGASYGTLTLASATHVSSNTAYARVVRKIGPEAVVDVAKRMGIQNELQPVNSIVLGSQGVNTLEMASAFGTLSTGGVHNKATAIKAIYDKNGNVIFESTPSKDKAISPEVSYAATNVLKGVLTGSGTGALAHLPDQDAAGKTGTSDDWNDSWFVGYTPQLSTAVWIGARQQRYIADNVGGANCCPVWKEFMLFALKSYSKEEFPKEKDPPFNGKISLYSKEEQQAIEDKKKKKEEEKKKKEEAEKKKQEEQAKKDAAKKPDKPKVEQPKPEPPPGDGGGEANGGGGDPGGDGGGSVGGGGGP